MQLTKQMVAPMNEARTAILAKDWATAKAKLVVAEAQVKTPTDRLALERLRIAMAAETNDYPQQIKSLESMLGSGLLAPADVKIYKGALARSYADSGDAAKAAVLFRAYVDEFGGTPDQYIGIANDAVKANDNATGVTYAVKAIDAAKAASGKPPESYYRVLLKAHQQAGEMDKYYAVEERALADYPKEAYWRELIARVQKEPNFGFATRLDMFRALQFAGVKLTPAEKSLFGSEAIKRGLPNEALEVLGPAVASGELGANEEDQNNLKSAKTQSVSDKAGLAKETIDVLAKGDASTIAKIGEAHLSYGDNAKAIEVLQAALAKGIADAGEADVAKLHLGIAQFRAGQKDAARATWAAVKADNGAGTIARNWILMSNLIP
jgi:tetratricopeptide (TPR) repeat protein